MKAFDRKEVSQTISQIELRQPKALLKLANLFGPQSLKKTLCFTGPAGVGKSSLVAELAILRTQKTSVAWLACDPSSPETGGSVLGDRIRLTGRETSTNLFVRSLSTRSNLAFSRAIRDIEIYLEQYFDEIWVETAGSGQTQTEVARISAATVLILQPETGDEIQWMKSGIREWADFFVINKSDLPGADSMRQSLIELGISEARIRNVSVKTGSGISDLQKDLARLMSDGTWASKRKLLHSIHSQDLYIEWAMKKLSADFKKAKSKWEKNPYRQLK